ncbi:MAG: DUF2997 domain-containing protein [Synechococcus sp.]|nr:DUF2997 domain-containing protein [Synechococcus sp.]
MPQRTLRFRIRPDGRVEEQVEGIEGEACLGLTERLETALGSVERREVTSEAYSMRTEQSQTLPVEHL